MNGAVMQMILYYLIIVILTPVSILLAWPAGQSQVRAKLAVVKFAENYSGRIGADVSSGSELVGVTLGKPPIISHDSDVLVALPVVTNETQIRIRAITRDGLFWSDNPFNASNNENDFVLAGPVTQAYGQVLKKYDPSDIIVRASVMRLNTLDNGNEEVILPALSGQDGSLRVYLLTHDNAASVQLKRITDKEQFIVSVRCEKFQQGSTVAADKECIFNFSPESPSGQYDMTIRIKNQLDKKDFKYKLYIPSVR